MNNFIEAMIKGHDKTDYRWISGKCAETCSHCDSLNNSIKPMYRWLAEGLPQALEKGKYHECGDDCSCRLEKF
jgi:hypothetical protein